MGHICTQLLTSFYNREKSWFHFSHDTLLCLECYKGLHIETNQFICFEKQWNSFYMKAFNIFRGIAYSYEKVCTQISLY